MRFLICSRFNKETIGSSFGLPEYSYYFVLKEFAPLLSTLGKVDVVATPQGAEALYERHTSAGEDCVFLHFTAPHNLARNIKCAAIPVFAWEFSSIPTDSWNGDGYNNWKLVLQKHGAAITHSQFTVNAVKDALGENYPVIAIPAPVWDRCETYRNRIREKLEQTSEGSYLLEFQGVVCDSRDIDFESLLQSRFPLPDSAGEQREDQQDDPEPEEAEAEPAPMPKSFRFRCGLAKNLLVQMYRECVADLLPTAVRRAISRLHRSLRPTYRRLFRHERPLVEDHIECVEQSQHEEHVAESPATDAERLNLLELSGVVYTTLFNPYDGRKNWETMLTAFCWAHRDHEDATLLIKLSANQLVFFTDQVVNILTRLRPFKCRIVIIKGFLENEQFEQFFAASSYYVNTSYGEGQCLPLMEFLSSGIPALSPRNTAMQDYMDEDLGFIIDSRPELTHWQHDERQMIRTFHYRADWTSTMEAFQESYRIYKTDPARYRTMSGKAINKMQNHCSIGELRERLAGFLKTLPARGPGQLAKSSLQHSNI